MHPRNHSTNRFSLFEKFAGNYTNKKILDYGGNRGNLLYFSQGKIKQENYTCIDVEKEAIQQGKIEFPNAHFIHYNRFSPMYNKGNIDEPFPILEEKFDICFAYSVFTHTDFFTFQQTINYLQNLSKKIILSFVSNDNVKIKKWVFDKRYKDYGYCTGLNIDCDYFYLIDNDRILISELCYNEISKHFFSFYEISFLRKNFNCDIFVNNSNQDFLLFD